MFQWHKEAAKKWDERADYWNQSSQEMWDHGSRSTIIPFFQKYVDTESKVLDVGCGDGYGSFKLYLGGYDVTGLDISEQMIEKAQKREGNQRLSFIQGDVNQLPFPQDSFDSIMAINSLEWTAEPLTALLELKRVLRSNGILCIGLLGPTAMPRTNSYQRLYDEHVICNTMMPWEFERLATENGFEVLDGHGVYKRDVTSKHIEGLPIELKQALTFMWVFIFKKK